MEIVALPPASVLEPWTDVTIGFPSGAVQSFTLRPGDTMQETPDLLVLTFPICLGRSRDMETLTFYLRQLAWLSKIVRLVAVDAETGKQVPVPRELP